MDCRLPGSPVHGILQARILEWVAISSSMNVYFVFSTEDTAVTKTDMVPDPHGAHSLVEETDLSPRTAPGGCAAWYVEAQALLLCPAF